MLFSSDDLAELIKQSYSAEGMPLQWRAGCDTACQRIAQHLSEKFDSRHLAEDFLRKCRP